MSVAAEAIVVGAGHNGLTCAAYLARGGVDVLVLEARDAVGGCASTVPALDGARVNVCNCDHSLVRATGIVEELDLAAHGLRYLELDPTQLALPWDGSAPWLHFRDRRPHAGVAVADAPEGGRRLPPLRARHRAGRPPALRAAEPAAVASRGRRHAGPRAWPRRPRPAAPDAHHARGRAARLLRKRGAARPGRDDRPGGLGPAAAGRRHRPGRRRLRDAPRHADRPAGRRLGGADRRARRRRARRGRAHPHGRARRADPVRGRGGDRRRARRRHAPGRAGRDRGRRPAHRDRRLARRPAARRTPAGRALARAHAARGLREQGRRRRRRAAAPARAGPRPPCPPRRARPADAHRGPRPDARGDRRGGRAGRGRADRGAPADAHQRALGARPGDAPAGRRARPQPRGAVHALPAARRLAGHRRARALARRLRRPARARLPRRRAPLPPGRPRGLRARLLASGRLGAVVLRRAARRAGGRRPRADPLHDAGARPAPDGGGHLPGAGVAGASGRNAAAVVLAARGGVRPRGGARRGARTYAPSASG